MLELLLALSLAQATPRYELRFYSLTGSGFDPVLTATVTPACTDRSPAPSPLTSINPTRHIFIDNRRFCIVDSAAILAKLPRSAVGATYMGTVARCDAGGCLESARTEFCVGVPEEFARDAPDCHAVKRRVEVWIWLCAVLWVCGQ